MNDSVDNDSADAVYITPREAPGSTEAEHEVWSGTPGQVTNLGTFILMTLIAAAIILWAPGVLIFAAVAPIAIAVIQAWSTNCVRYRLTTQRLLKSWGIFTEHGPIPGELYRIAKNPNASAPFLYRLFGRGNVVVFSDDFKGGRLTLKAIKDHKDVQQLIRTHTETMRKAKGTRVVE